jgi:hypothetical protein
MQLNAEFVKFLLTAKQATYAGGGPHAAASRPASADLHFQQGDYLYIDTYLGARNFAGEEAVWWQGTPAWAMNYYGWMLCAEIPVGFGEFLKAALRRAPAQAPFRGPQAYGDGPFEFLCRWQGDLARFTGEEEIRWQGEVIYRLVFHGGNIS